MARALLFLVFAVFGAFSTYVLYDVGYVGIFRGAFASSGSIQVLCDLCISLSLVCIWIVADARNSGRKAWPYLLIALFLGSFGPLLYLMLRPRQQSADGRIVRPVAAHPVH